MFPGIVCLTIADVRNAPELTLLAIRNANAEIARQAFHLVHSWWSNGIIGGVFMYKPFARKIKDDYLQMEVGRNTNLMIMRPLSHSPSLYPIITFINVHHYVTATTSLSYLQSSGSCWLMVL